MRLPKLFMKQLHAVCPTNVSGSGKRDNKGARSASMGGGDGEDHPII